MHCYHYGDEETQIVFYGTEVSPKSIIYLRNDGGDWQVMPAYEIRGRDYLYSGTYEKCVKWVIQNFTQYRKYLVGR